MKAYELLDKEWSVYPGHPVTVAYLIVKIYPNYEEAFAGDGTVWDYPNALSDNRIPGAGGNVSSAISLLRDLRESNHKLSAKGKECSVWEAAMCWAAESWSTCDGQAKGGYDGNSAELVKRYKDRWKLGQEQADRLEPLLLECENWWTKEVG